MNKAGNVVAFCLIFHSMCVSDRFMRGDVNAFCDPVATLDKDVTEACSIQIPLDMKDVLNKKPMVMIVLKQLQ